MTAWAALALNRGSTNPTAPAACLPRIAKAKLRTPGLFGVRSTPRYIWPRADCATRATTQANNATAGIMRRLIMVPPLGCGPNGRTRGPPATLRPNPLGAQPRIFTYYELSGRLGRAD